MTSWNRVGAVWVLELGIREVLGTSVVNGFSDGATVGLPLLWEVGLELGMVLVTVDKLLQLGASPYSACFLVSNNGVERRRVRRRFPH